MFQEGSRNPFKHGEGAVFKQRPGGQKFKGVTPAPIVSCRRVSLRPGKDIFGKSQR